MTENNFGNTGSGSMSSPAGAGDTTPATETCPTCGQSMAKGGVEEMLNRLKSQFQNVDLDEYMNTAREYLKTGSTKATTFAKENPAKIAAGAAAIALGAGLLYAALHRGKTDTTV